MLVYGDPKFSCPLLSLVARLRRHLARTNPESLDDLRSLLIVAGQVEQAVADWVSENPSGKALQTATEYLTDSIARLFCRAWKWSTNSPANTKSVADALETLDQLVRQGARTANASMTIKIPEGFAFYALFPEQYCATTLEWLWRNSDRGRVLVVGIRSIGTTLSAAVKEMLRLNGCEARRFTVRPTGHPFQRHLELEFFPAATDRVLVVDEGPGISGSSMAAVAEAFTSAGVRDVSFLPGHKGGPGPSASANIRAIWERTPRYVTIIEEMKWNGLSLAESLAAETEKLDPSHPVERVEDLNVGRWREFVFKRENDWPPSGFQFERMKFLCLRHGVPSVLWKFAGLHTTEHGQTAAEAVVARLERNAEAGFGPASFGAFRGFVALPWIDGTRHARADAADPEIARQIGRYILHAVGPALTSEERHAAVTRLAEMLYWNTKETLGDSAAEQTRFFAEAAHECEMPISYGDGRLAPHEWIRAADGQIFKVDDEGHASDHTLVGAQSLLWDIAGTWVEWDLDSRSAAPLLSELEQGGIRFDAEALTFYRLAYGAFRLGVLSIGSHQTTDTHEQIRIERAREFYVNQLTGLLKTAAVPA